MVAYGLGSLQSYLEYEIKDHNLFKDCEHKEDLVLNCHKRIYLNPIDNQRLIKGVRLKIPENVLKSIEKLPRFEKFHAYTSVVEYVRNFLNKKPCTVDELIISFECLSESKK